MRMDGICSAEDAAALRCADCMCEISSFGLRRIGMGLLLIGGFPSHCAGPVGRGGGVGPAGRALPCWGALALPAR